jgi:hypothetical protein
MQTRKGSHSLPRKALVFSGLVLGVLFSTECWGQSLWKESQSLRAYDGPEHPREELALVGWGSLSPMLVESVDGKATSEFAKAAGQKEVMADTMKNRVLHSPHRLHWPYGCLLLPGEHVLVVTSRSQPTGHVTLKFAVEKGQEYRLGYEALHRSTHTKMYPDGGYVIESETTGRPVIIQLSNKKVVSTVVEE